MCLWCRVEAEVGVGEIGIWKVLGATSELGPGGKERQAEGAAEAKAESVLTYSAVGSDGRA